MGQRSPRTFNKSPDRPDTWSGQRRRFFRFRHDLHGIGAAAVPLHVEVFKNIGDLYDVNTARGWAQAWRRPDTRDSHR